MPEAEAAASRRALVHLSAALATREGPRIEAALRRAREAAPPLAVEETILQAHLFIGFPTALEAMRAWREVSGSQAPAPSPEEPPLWTERGAAVCETVYAANYRKLRENVAALHPDLERWMVEGGYGRVIGRPGLDLATRELCIAALLAVWRAPRQLHSHLRGALNAGALQGEVEEAVGIACEYLTEAAAAEVVGLWQTVARRAAHGAGTPAEG